MTLAQLYLSCWQEFTHTPTREHTHACTHTDTPSGVSSPTSEKIFLNSSLKCSLLSCSYSGLCSSHGGGLACGLWLYHFMVIWFVWFDVLCPSTIFRLNRDESYWVEPVLSQDKCVLHKDHNAVTSMRLEPAPFLVILIFLTKHMIWDFEHTLLSRLHL